jgi:uncharacterized protein YbbC (DUF1343 family)/CubicO group peptidase (beta-lactamase class C family)
VVVASPRLGVLVLLLLAAAVVARPCPAAAADFAAVEEVIGEALQSGEIPGAVVLVGRGEEILLHRAYGWRQLSPSPMPMTTDTIFDIASLTKPLGTTLAVMALVERGAVRLDAPLGRYLREFKRKPEITVQRLLTHSAGLPAIPLASAVRLRFPKAARALARLPLDYPPGSATQYSDTGFILLGELVRRVSGQPLDRFLASRFFRPLGLRDTFFNPPRSLRRRIAPTEYHHDGLLLGVVHDPRARLLRGVAGHAGMFSTAADLARLCRMLIGGGALEGRRVLKSGTVQALWVVRPDGNGNRALGWDVSSGYARGMMPFFPAGAVGHTGFTGTSVWIDPASRTYLILLTNRVHPNGGGAAKIRELRTRVTAAVGAALFRGPEPVVAEADVFTAPAADGPAESRIVPPTAPIRTGLDVLVAQDFAPLAGKRVGLVTNHTGVDASGRRAIDLIAGAPGVRLHAIFSPEHGLTGEANAEVPHGRDAATRVPVWSLYGPTRRPNATMLRDVDILVFDVQDVGVRYYTYLTTLVYIMDEAARHQIPVMVLDRPNPITGRYVEGPLTDPDLESFTAPHSIPVRTGMTIGEFARMALAERSIPVRLTVVPLENWARTRWYDETGLVWTNPSPNIRSVTQALLYSGIGLLEATNLSVGRGTDWPFEVIGAPWIEPRGLAAGLNALGLPGVRFEPIEFTPADDRYARTACGGVRFVVTDREAIRPVTVALAVARALRERHRDQWKPEQVQNLLVNRSTMWAFLRGEPLPRLLAWSEMARSAFLARRASYLIY